jgi:hypothetical protein
MGYQQRRITVEVYVSRHNAPEDRRDDALADELADRIRHIAMEHRYEHIQPEVYG